MTWVPRGGILVWDEDSFPEPSPFELAPYVADRRRRPSSCGKPGGRTAHLRAGTPVCEACRVAWREYDRQSKARRRAAARAARLEVSAAS